MMESQRLGLTLTSAVSQSINVFVGQWIMVTIHIAWLEY